MSNWRGFVAKLCGWLAAVFLAAMMLLTVADVVLRAVSNTPIRGVVELVELLLACTFFLALPATFLRDENIVVDMIDTAAPRAVPLLRWAAAVLGAIVLGIMGWQGWIAAQDTLAFNDVTSDLSLPKILYWIPVLIGLFGGCAAAIVMAVPARRRR
jgi:TRAP-type C4-dicarboxylate transport system permease small subunit